MRENIGEIIDSMAEIVNTLTPAELDRILKPVRNINKNLGEIVEHLNGNYLLLDDNPQKHTYFVNNIYAKAQLQKITPKGVDIRINPDIELGTIIMVKQY